MLSHDYDTKVDKVVTLYPLIVSVLRADPDGTRRDCVRHVTVGAEDQDGSTEQAHNDGRRIRTRRARSGSQSRSGRTNSVRGCADGCSLVGRLVARIQARAIRIVIMFANVD